jgi:hypothetical protein
MLCKGIQKQTHRRLHLETLHHEEMTSGSVILPLKVTCTRHIYYIMHLIKQVFMLHVFTPRTLTVPFGPFHIHPKLYTVISSATNDITKTDVVYPPQTCPRHRGPSSRCMAQNISGTTHQARTKNYRCPPSFMGSLPYARIHEQRAHPSKIFGRRIF